jgi:lipoprotein-anchoring transpeptidase ErfK/SrfK
MGASREARGRRLTIVVCAVVVAVLALVVALLLYDHSQRDVIANGVRVDGVSVGGLSEADARAKVQRDLVANLQEPITVRSSSHSWTLTGRDADVTVNADRMIAQALHASREGSIFTRATRELFGGSVHRDVPLEVSYSLPTVRGLTAKVRSSIDRAPQNATVQPTASGLQSVVSHTGVTVNNDLLGSRVEAALTGVRASRSVTVPTRTVQPSVTTAQLASKYPTYIVVDREAFRLRFYEHLKLSKTYEIAVGMQGLETPPGLYHIQWKEVDPPWLVPNKAWAGSLAGTVVPPGPADPLKARFMSFDGGAGIHGIDPSEYSSIGHDASHGCVRMRIPDVIALYSRTPVGTPVYIV